MKILSRFKDYYDFLAHQYGVDEKIIFNRDLFPNKNTTTKLFETTEFNFSINKNYIPFTRKFYGDTLKFTTDILVVNGKGYIIYSSLGFRFDAAKTSKIYFSGQDHVLDEQLTSSRPFFSNNTLNYVEFNIPYIEHLVEMVGSPVFVITNYTSNTVSVANKTPNLGELGFAKYKDAYTMYQETACYINKVFSSVEPPIELSNEDRIVAHGFDLKTSFRGKQ